MELESVFCSFSDSSDCVFVVVVCLPGLSDCVCVFV